VKRVSVRIIDSRPNGMQDAHYQSGFNILFEGDQNVAFDIF